MASENGKKFWQRVAENVVTGVAIIAIAAGLIAMANLFFTWEDYQTGTTKKVEELGARVFRLESLLMERENSK